MTDASLEHLAKLESLESLVLEENGHITGEGFAVFPENTRLRSLRLGDLEKLSAIGLRNLPRLRSLKQLSIYSKNLTNQHLEALIGMPTLEQIDIRGDFNYESYRQLVESLPNLNREDD